MVEIGDEEEGVKLNVYGRGKTGKTRFACTFPQRLMLIGAAGLGTEKGTKSLGRMKGSKFFPLGHSEEIEELAVIAVEDEYASIILDTAGGLQERVVDEYLSREASVKKDWRTVPKGDWVPINAKTIQRLRCLLDLADQHGKHVVIIAHERNFGDEASDNEFLLPSVGSALTPGVAGWLDGACDYICGTFIREATEMRQVKLAGKKKAVARKTGGMEYCLRVGPHPVFKTGFRLPPGVELPDVIVDPTYAKVASLIQGET